MLHCTFLFFRWVYLEPIFSSGTLQQERSRFDRLDRDFRHIMSAVERDTRVMSLGRYPNIRTLLDTLQDLLNRCQNSLDDFLKVCFILHFCFTQI